jgi:molybdopterin biosynthesis enzyme MoaB
VADIASIVSSPFPACLVSDTAAADASADISGPTIKDIVAQHDHECVESRIVPDEESQIRDAVSTWARNGAADWVITTGGTGFGVRDRTPEVRALTRNSSICGDHVDELLIRP